MSSEEQREVGCVTDLGTNVNATEVRQATH